MSPARSRAEVGVWLDRTTLLANGSSVYLLGSAGYAHDWWTNPALTAQFVSLPSTSFTASGITPPANLALVTGMTEWRNRDGLSFGVKFDGEFSASSMSYAGTATFRYRW